MSYYDNPQWTGPAQNNWENKGPAAPARALGASGPQTQDDYAFSCQFDEVDRAYENLQKSGKGYGIWGRHSRASHGGGPRSHAVNSFDDVCGSSGSNLHSFYASQRHQSYRGTNEAEQFMQTKRRMAAQRERELRNRHTEQQYQRNLSEAPKHTNNHMSEEETRELIARQRSALYGEGPFADRSSYVDESGNIRTVANASGTPASASDHNAPAVPSPRPQSTTSPQTGGSTNRIYETAVGFQSRTSSSSPTGGSSPRDLAPGSKPGAVVAPIGTRPSGTPSAAASGKRSTTPLTSPSGWGRGKAVWGQSSGLGAQASVWG